MSENNMIQDDKITVNIFNNEYPLKAVKDPEHIFKVAETIDGKMRAIAEQNKYLSPDRIAVLVALELADQLELLRSDYEALWQMVTEYQENK